MHGWIVTPALLHSWRCSHGSNMLSIVAQFIPVAEDHDEPLEAVNAEFGLDEANARMLRDLLDVALKSFAAANN